MRETFADIKHNLRLLVGFFVHVMQALRQDLYLAPASIIEANRLMAATDENPNLRGELHALAGLGKGPGGEGTLRGNLERLLKKLRDDGYLVLAKAHYAPGCRRLVGRRRALANAKASVVRAKRRHRPTPAQADGAGSSLLLYSADSGIHPPCNSRGGAAIQHCHADAERDGHLRGLERHGVVDAVTAEAHRAPGRAPFFDPIGLVLGQGLGEAAGSLITAAGRLRLAPRLKSDHRPRRPALDSAWSDTGDPPAPDSPSFVGLCWVSCRPDCCGGARPPVHVGPSSVRFSYLDTLSAAHA
ncbi:hypothetical protein [Halochromatium glycolicum]|uniref:Uncharacterized protein n=1 Tax=Halochromatium glycolicum TaxID=85075 RepID=A0AAJ0U3P8_9GAMM|nr:hypothetical protein [Halochromatium glycolicum]MBK1704723.1 hypothetical protein [Halochromatium glycolicum]